MDRKIHFLWYWLTVPFLSVTAFAAGPSNDLRMVVAAQNQDKATVRSLVRQHADVNTRQPSGATALSWAAHWNDLEMAELLIRAGANVNAANELGITPLLRACTNGSAPMVEKLLKVGADVNIRSATGETVLMTCASTGNLGAVKMLLDYGAEVNANEASSGQTALMWAVAEKHPDVARLLIERGADIRARSKAGFTPLLFAAQQGDIDSARMLLASGANVNETWNSASSRQSAPGGQATVQRGMTPLMLAAASGQEAFAMFLLEYGADPNAFDSRGTALHYAIRKGILYANRQDSSSKWDSPNKRLPNLKELVKALVAHGADVNARLLENPAVSLVASGAAISLVGGTPLLLAAASADADLVRFLLDHGADPELATDKKTTPLMMAAGVGRTDDRLPEEDIAGLEVVKMLVARGSDINAANEEDGQTPLHGAAMIGASATVRFLIEKGAKPDIMDSYGQTPLSIAMGLYTKNSPRDFHKAPFGPHQSTVDLLLKLGATPLEASGVELMDVVKDSAVPVAAAGKK